MTIIDDVGEGITITQVDKVIDEYGDSTDTTSDSTITAVVEILGADEDIIKSGILTIGDAFLYFKPGDASSIHTGNRVTHNSITYVITAIDSLGMGGTAIHGEAQLRRKIE